MNSPRIKFSLMKFGSAAVMILAVSRCSTISERGEYGLRAPSSVAIGDSHEIRDPSTIKDPAMRAVYIYRAATLAAKAAGQPNVEACEGFRTLAIEPTLKLPEPVRVLARVRTVAVCPPDRALAVEQPPKWIAEESARTNLVVARGRLTELAKGSPDNAAGLKTLAIALRNVAPYEKTQKMKVARLEEARQIFDRLLTKATGDKSEDTELEKERTATITQLISAAPRFALSYDLAQMDASARVPDRLAIASDLRNAREFDKARAIFSEIAADKARSPQDRLKALDGIRMSYKLQLRTPEFIAATKKWQAFAAKNFFEPGVKRRDSTLLKTYLDTRIQYARAVWTDHRPADAKKILLETEAKLTSGKIAKPLISLHESMLIRARIAEERGDFAETAAILQQVAIDQLPDRATKARFLWYKGWNLRRLSTPVVLKAATAKPGEFAKPTTDFARESIAALELAQTFEDRQSDLTRDKYWAARIYKQLGETEKSRQLFTDLAEESPFGFYGIIAQRELGLPFSSLKSPSEKSYSPAGSSPVADAIRVPADWFIALDEYELGRRYVDSFPAREVWDSSFSLDKKEATLVLLSRLEQHIVVSQRVDELQPEDRKRLLLKRPELVFPLPYENRILEETTRQNIPPALVYSIMRQESLFNPFARSPADAFGLMQLIPEMAQAAAKSLGTEFHGPEDLYEPDKNIAFGTVFLKDLFKKYNQRFILAVAAYNANDRAIQGWVKTRMRPDPLEFIEEIPYDETRLYVKLVMRNFVTYQRRLSSTPVEFSESLLRL